MSDDPTETVHEALEALSEARDNAGAKAKRSALRKAVNGLRRDFTKTHGLLSRTVIEAMELWDEQKAGGVSLADRQRGLFNVLRDAWPQVREWKYLCQNCNDTGLVMAECSGDANCGRSKVHLPHDFGTPCWCSLGSRFKEHSKPTPEDFTQAGRSKPTRIGRRN